METAIALRNQTQLINALPPSIERVVHVGQSNIQQAVNLLKSSERELLKTEMVRLQKLLVPSTEKEIMACLGKLILHYPQTNMDENHMSLLFSDYLDDLEPYPAWAISDACKTYRRNVESRFFPSVGILLAEIQHIVWPITHKLKTIEKVLKTEQEKEKPKISDKEIEKIKAQYLESPTVNPYFLTKEQKISATVEHMKSTGASQADIDAFVAGEGA